MRGSARALRAAAALLALGAWLAASGAAATRLGGRTQAAMFPESLDAGLELGPDFNPLLLGQAAAPEPSALGDPFGPDMEQRLERVQQSLNSLGGFAANADDIGRVLDDNLNLGSAPADGGEPRFAAARNVVVPITTVAAATAAFPPDSTVVAEAARLDRLRREVALARKQRDEAIAETRRVLAEGRAALARIEAAQRAARRPAAKPEAPVAKPKLPAGFKPPALHKPKAKPAHKPTPKPTHKPTPKPTHKPTPKPTHKPTPKPTQKPKAKPKAKQEQEQEQSDEDDMLDFANDDLPASAYREETESYNEQTGCYKRSVITHLDWEGSTEEDCDGDDVADSVPLTPNKGAALAPPAPAVVPVKPAKAAGQAAPKAPIPKVTIISKAPADKAADKAKAPVAKVTIGKAPAPKAATPKASTPKAAAPKAANGHAAGGKAPAPGAAAGKGARFASDAAAADDDNWVKPEEVAPGLVRDDALQIRDKDEMSILRQADTEVEIATAQTPRTVMRAGDATAQPRFRQVEQPSQQQQLQQQQQQGEMSEEELQQQLREALAERDQAVAEVQNSSATIAAMLARIQALDKELGVKASDDERQAPLDRANAQLTALQSAVKQLRDREAADAAATAAAQRAQAAAQAQNDKLESGVRAAVEKIASLTKALDQTAKEKAEIEREKKQVLKERKEAVAQVNKASATIHDLLAQLAKTAAHFTAKAASVKEDSHDLGAQLDAATAEAAVAQVKKASEVIAASAEAVKKTEGELEEGNSELAKKLGDGRQRTLAALTQRNKQLTQVSAAAKTIKNLLGAIHDQNERAAALALKSTPTAQLQPRFTTRVAGRLTPAYDVSPVTGASAVASASAGPVISSSATVVSADEHAAATALAAARVGLPAPAAVASSEAPAPVGKTAKRQPWLRRWWRDRYEAKRSEKRKTQDALGELLEPRVNAGAAAAVAKVPLTAFKHISLKEEAPLPAAATPKPRTRADKLKQLAKLRARKSRADVVGKAKRLLKKLIRSEARLNKAKGAAQVGRALMRHVQHASSALTLVHKTQRRAKSDSALSKVVKQLEARSRRALRLGFTAHRERLMADIANAYATVADLEEVAGATRSPAARAELLQRVRAAEQALNDLNALESSEAAPAK